MRKRREGGRERRGMDVIIYLLGLFSMIDYPEATYYFAMMCSTTSLHLVYNMRRFKQLRSV